MGRTTTLLRGLKLHGRIEYFLFLAGVNLVLLHFIMVRHATIAFHHGDVAFAVFSLAFFAGISLGYGISDRVSLVTIRRGLPVVLIVQMAMILLVPSFYYVVSRDIGTWAGQHELSEDAGKWVASAAVFLLVTVGVSAPYSVFLPLIIQSQEQNLRRYVSIASAGAVVGLLSAPALSTLAHVWLLSGSFVTFIAVGVALGARRLMTLGLTTLIVLFLVNFDTWDRTAAAWFYQHRYGTEIQRVVETRYTPYHKIEVLELGSGEHMLTLNGQRPSAGTTSSSHDFFVAQYPAERLTSPSVCALGGTSISSVQRIGDRTSSIRIVDLDPAVLETARRFSTGLPEAHPPAQMSFIVDDPSHFLANSRDHFDLILHCLPLARSRQLALAYTAEFFSSAKARLAPTGIFSTACPSPFDSKSQYGKRLLATLTHVFDHYFVLAYGDSAYFYGGRADLSPGDEASVRSAVQSFVETSDGSPGDVEIRVVPRHEIDELLRNVPVITTNNVGDLIYG